VEVVTCSGEDLGNDATMIVMEEEERELTYDGENTTQESKELIKKATTARYLAFLFFVSADKSDLEAL